MRFSRQEALDMGKPAPELASVTLPPIEVPWADPSRLNALFGVDAERSMAGPPEADVEEFDRDVPFRDGHQMPARIYRPKTPPAEGSPLLVFYHGGGWIGGTQFQGAKVLRRLAKIFGVVAVSLSYRLAPEHTFPTPQFDAYDGLKWAAQNAHALKADPVRGFIISGASAGGQLAAVCGHHWVREKRSPLLTGSYFQIAWILASSQVPENYREFYNSPYQEAIKDAPVLNTDDLPVLDAFLKADPTSDWHSPFASADAHKGMPPAYFQLSGRDPLRDHSLIYEDVLREAGVKTRLDVYPGLFHGFALFLQSIPQFAQSLNDQVKGFAFLLGKSEMDIQQFLM